LKLFYHTDLDGKCAAAIVWRWHAGQGACEAYPINYNMPFPLASIEPGEQVVIVDYSILPAEMDQLLDRTTDVTWIDHHRTAIEKYANSPREVAGIRDTTEAGCVLTWRYLFPSEPVPEAVVLVGDRDIWRWAFGDRTKFFNTGMNAVPNAPGDPMWGAVFAGNQVEELIADGMIIERYRESWFAGFLKAWAFETEIAGERALCINLANCGSEAFGDNEKKYPILCSFVWDGRQWAVSLYSATGVDVGRIAETFGGGGHPKASGFQCAELPFQQVGSG